MSNATQSRLSTGLQVNAPASPRGSAAAHSSTRASAPQPVESPPRTAASHDPSVAVPQSVRSDLSRYWLTPARVGLFFTALLLYVGYATPTERFITPESGIGYALGIVGGSSMLLLLLYPARKRVRWLSFIGSVKLWFQAHMVLGIVGPLFVLYHSNFSLGATNSNVALFTMLIVSGSGIAGRHFYTRIHFGLYGRRATRAEMQSQADELKKKVTGSRFVPDLLDLLDVADQKLLRQKKGVLRLMVRPMYVTAQMYLQRWAVTRIATNSLRRAAADSPVLAQQHSQFAVAVRRYIRQRLQATRQVAEFESYERLFSLWHMLHLPLFFLLLVAGIVHVIAVHVY
jgi:hypothetical protein